MWLKVVVILILAALFAPILVVIPLSFTSISYFEFPPPSYSTKWYSNFMGNEEWVTGLIRSLNAAFLTAIIATALGTMAATAVLRVRFWGKKLFMALMVAPMIIPVIIVGIAMYYSFSMMKLTDSMLGLVLAHTVLAIPIVFITVMASMKGIDRNLELAAMGLGSSPIGVFFKITLPLIRPALLSGFLFAFITSLDEVVVTIFVTGARTKTLPIVMWENMTTQIDPTMAAVSTVLIVGTVTLFLVQAWASSRSKSARLKHDS